MLFWLYMCIEFVLVILFNESVLESGAMKFVGYPLCGCVACAILLVMILVLVFFYNLGKKF